MQILEESRGEGAYAIVPVQAWHQAHLGLQIPPPVMEGRGDHIRVERRVVDTILQALAHQKGEEGSAKDDDSINDQWGH